MGAKVSKETSTIPRARARFYTDYGGRYVVNRERGEAAQMVRGKGRKQATDAADLWANLSPDLVRLIAGKLTNICDYVRLRCVCHSWRSATGTSDHINRFLPWAICPCSTNTTAISLLNISDGRNHSFHLPEVQGKWIYGSSHGWLVMIGPPPNPSPAPTAVSLHNPLTRAQIDLPSLPEQMMLTSFTLTSALLCSHPISSQPRQLLVAVWDYDSKSLAVFNQGDNDWILYNSGSSTVQFGDIAYFDGALYFSGSDGKLAVLDVATSEVRELLEPRPPPDDIVRIYYDLPEYAGIYYNLAESAGDLLLIPKYYGINDQLPLITFIFKLDMNGNGEREWVKVAGANGRNLISLFTSSNLPAKSSDVPNEYPSYADDTVAGILYGITTGKIHYLQTWCRESWLIPSLY